MLLPHARSPVGGVVGSRGYRLCCGDLRTLKHRVVEEDGECVGIVSAVSPHHWRHRAATRAALPKLAGHRRTVPCELGESDFERLLGGCDCSHDVGIRDCAILTVLWRLGLRRAEVAGLRVDDIDWRRGEITIRGKGNCHELLPMPIDVGDAIVRYLHDGHRRVPPTCCALFVQVRAPEGAMTPGGVGDVVTKVSVRVGLPALSAHRLRHGTATQLIFNGASWPEIAQLMRHRTIAVTASYATVDPALTSELARPWPGAL